MRALLIKPRGPTRPVTAHVEPAPTAEYGRYLVHTVANCALCHTKVNQRTGAFSGPLLGGGAVFQARSDPTKHFVSPNLTPDPRWGWIASWPEEVFVARFHLGRQHPQSPMPWQAYQRMSDDDLRAIFRYLKTVPGAQGGPDPSQRDAVAWSGER